MKSIVISSWQAARKVREKNKQIVERVRGKGDDVNYWRNTTCNIGRLGETKTPEVGHGKSPLS